MANKKVFFEAMQITGVDTNWVMKLRSAWLGAASDRAEFLESLVKMGMRGKDYSSSVAEYDRKHMKVF